MVWTAFAALALFVATVLLNTPTLSWGPKIGIVGVIAMFAMLIAAFLPPARSNAENSRLHSIGESAHHCQCRDCGRTFTAAPDSAPGPPHGIAAPQQVAATARSVLQVSPFAGHVLLVALIAAVTVEATVSISQSGSVLHFFISEALISVLMTAAMLLVFGGGLLAIALFARARSSAMEHQIASHSPRHGCTCLWCGRKNTPQVSDGRGPHSV